METRRRGDAGKSPDVIGMNFKRNAENAGLRCVKRAGIFGKGRL